MKVKYFDRFKGWQEREYTQEMHGENFEALAKEFCETNAEKQSSIVEEVKEVEKPKRGRPKKETEVV